jgi:hypothetical protein
VAALLFCALLTSAATAVAAPGPNRAQHAVARTRPLPATPQLYTVAQSAPVSAPSGTRTNGEATCPAGTVVWGGGVSIASTSTSVSLGNSFPFGGGSSAGWFATVSNQSSATVTFVVQAVCAKAPRKYRVVTGAPVAAPAGGQTSAQAKCPAGSALGGGSISQNAVTISSAYPGSDATSWHDSLNNPTSGDASFQVVMVCGRTPATYAVTAGSPVTDRSHSQKTATATCSSGKPLAGGVLSSSTSTAVSLGSSSATSTGWSVTENNGSGAGTTIQAFVICA